MPGRRAGNSLGVAVCATAACLAPFCKADGPADVEQASRAVVMISGQFDDSATFGAGLIFGDDGQRLHVLTAAHVVHRGSGDARNLHVRLKRSPAVDTAEVAVKRVDPALDLAVVEVTNRAALGIAANYVPRDILPPRGRIRAGRVWPVGNPNGQPWKTEVDGDSLSGVSGGALFYKDGVVAGIINADSPPFGRATPIWTALDLLQRWGFHIDLYERTPGETPLHHAAKVGDVAAIQRLASPGSPDLNAVNPSDETPLDIAAQNGQAAAAAALLELGANPNPRNDATADPLRDAGQAGHPDVAKVLLEHGARVDPFLLSLAAGPAGDELIPLLLKAGAKPDFDRPEMPYQRHPLVDVAEKGRVSQIKMLLAAGAPVTPEAIDAAASKHQHDAVAFLLGTIPRVDTFKLREVWEACAGDAGWADVVQLLMQKSSNDLTAKVKDNWYIRLIEELLSQPFGPDAVDYLRILLAPLTTIKQLISDPVSTVFAYAEHGFQNLPTPAKLEMLELLISKGALSTGRSYDDVLCDLTSKHWPDAPEVFRFLITHSPTSPTRSKMWNEVGCSGGGISFLYSAIEADNEPIAKALLALGANANGDIIHQDRIRPLQQAVTKPEIVKLLLAAHADPNGRDEDGRTALHYAAAVEADEDEVRRALETIQLLVRAGANVNAADKSGSRPLGSARDVRIAGLLRSYGAR